MACCQVYSTLLSFVYTSVTPDVQRKMQHLIHDERKPETLSLPQCHSLGSINRILPKNEFLILSSSRAAPYQFCRNSGRGVERQTADAP